MIATIATIWMTVRKKPFFCRRVRAVNHDGDGGDIQ